MSYSLNDVIIWPCNLNSIFRRSKEKFYNQGGSSHTIWRKTNSHFNDKTRSKFKRNRFLSWIILWKWNDNITFLLWDRRIFYTRFGKFKSNRFWSSFSLHSGSNLFHQYHKWLQSRTRSHWRDQQLLHLNLWSLSWRFCRKKHWRRKYNVFKPDMLYEFLLPKKSNYSQWNLNYLRKFKNIWNCHKSWVNINNKHFSMIVNRHSFEIFWVLHGLSAKCFCLIIYSKIINDSNLI